MQTRWRWLLVVAGLLLGFMCGRVFALEMSLDAQVDRNQIQAGESLKFTLSLTIPMSSGGGRVSPPPQVDSIPGFDIVSRSTAQNMTWVNSEGVAQIQTRYELVPQQPGKAVIPGFSLKTPEGKTLTTKPIEITVAAPSEKEGEEEATASEPSAEPETPSQGMSLLKGLFLFGTVIALVIGIPIGLSMFLNSGAKPAAKRTRSDADAVQNATTVSPRPSNGNDKVNGMPGNAKPQPKPRKEEPAELAEPIPVSVDFDAEMAALKRQFPEANAEFYRHLFELFRRSVLAKAHRFGQALTPDELLRAIGRALPATEEPRIKRLSSDWESVAWAGMPPSRGVGEILEDIRALLQSLRRLES